MHISRADTPVPLDLDLITGLPGAPLLLRMALVAVFVVLVAIVAERLGPFLGGMVASLPLYTGPIYLMLALEHDADYLAAATLGSLAICGATPIYALAYCVAARRLGTLMSLAAGFTGWTACAVIVQATTWTLIEALLFVTPIYAVTVPLARGFTRGIAIRSAGRGRFDLLLRAMLCGGLAGMVITASKFVPPHVTGILSVLPILLTSLILVLHPRIGGPATAALIAHTLGGLIGMVLAFILVNQTLHAWGIATSLAAGLAVTVVWNIGLIVGKRLMAPNQHTAPAVISAPSMPPGPLPPPLPPRRPPAASPPRR